MDWLKRLIGRPRENTPERVENPIHAGNPTEMLANALREHGVEVGRTGDILLLPRDLGMKAFIHDLPASHPGTYFVSFELVAASPLTGNKPIFSCMFGHGESREHAVANSFVKTMIGPLHVMLESLSDHVCDPPQASVETWTSESASWKVFEGPVVNEETEASTHSLTTTYREHGWPALRRLFEATQSSGPHAISVTLASFNGDVSGIEIMLDNTPWAEAIEHFRTLPWPSRPGYESARHFAIALPIT